MKGILKFALVISVVGVAYFAYRTFFTAGLVVPPADPAKLACSVVTDIDFAVAIDDSARGGPKKIMAVLPTSGATPKVLQLQHESKLTTSAPVLCEGSAPGSPICAKVNAFTWGYDWIPLKTHSAGEPYCLAPLNSEGPDNEGWAILYFTRGNEIFGLGWGGALDKHWPPASNPKLIKIASNSYPIIADQEPLHTTAGIKLRGATLYGLDFNAWVDPIGAGGPGSLQTCFPIPPAVRHPARLYFATPFSGPDNSGMMVWYTEPEKPDDVWVWSEPALLGTVPIRGFSAKAEIDSMAFDRRLNENQERHLLISIVEDGTPLPLADADEPGAVAGGYFIVTVAGDDGKVVFGEPQMLSIELTTSDGDSGDVVLLQTVIGPRSRGTCSTDPTLFRRVQHQ